MAIEHMAMRTIRDRRMDFSDFAAVMQLVVMDSDELYRTCVGNKVPNFFRQDHGYKEGRYVKVWNGREDNEHLAELLAELDANSASFQDDLYAALAAAYLD